MKIEARLFYDALKTYSKLTAPEVKAFMVGKSFPALKSTLRAEISYAKIDGVINVIRTTASRFKTILRQIIDDLDVNAMIDDWVDEKVYSQLMNDLLESVYEKLVGAV
jgi:hypothetical protein